MADLDETQAWLAARVRALQPSLDRVTAELHLAAGPRLTALEQLEIYREQFWLRHGGALAEDFPGLVRLLGEERWQLLVEAYLGAFPPTSPSLRDLGRELPAFLERQPDVEPAWLDLARVEWAYVECFDAEDRAPLDRAALSDWSAEDWEAAQLELGPALRLLELGSAAADVRRELLQGGRPPLGSRPDPRFLVVYRAPDGSLWDKPLPEPAFRLLEELGRGTPLGLACERVVAGTNESPAAWEGELGSWFADFGRLGWIVGARPAPAVTSR